MARLQGDGFRTWTDDAMNERISKHDTEWERLIRPYYDSLVNEQIKAYVLEKTGLKVSSLYIAQIKKKCGLDVGENFNPAKSENARQPQCTPEKEDAIMQAFRHFGII